MAWVESHQTLLNHRKTLRLSARLKCDRYKVIGHLHALWWWALDNADTFGHLGDVTDTELAIAAGWPERRAAQWVAALTESEWLESTADGRVLHDWWDYAGKLMEQRDRERERSRQRREEARANRSGQPIQTDRPPDDRRSDQRSTAGTVPDRTQPVTQPPYPPDDSDQIEHLIDGLLGGHPGTVRQVNGVRRLVGKLPDGRGVEVLRYWLKQRSEDPFGSAFQQLQREADALKPKHGKASDEWAYLDETDEPQAGAA